MFRVGIEIFELSPSRYPRWNLSINYFRVWLYTLFLLVSHTKHCRAFLLLLLVERYITTSRSRAIFPLLSIFLFLRILQAILFLHYIFSFFKAPELFQRWKKKKKKKKGRTEIAHLQNESIMRVSVSMPDWFPAAPVMEMQECVCPSFNYYSNLCPRFPV